MPFRENVRAAFVNIQCFGIWELVFLAITESGDGPPWTKRKTCVLIGAHHSGESTFKNGIGLSVHVYAKSWWWLVVVFFAGSSSCRKLHVLLEVYQNSCSFRMYMSHTCRINRGLSTLFVNCYVRTQIVGKYCSFCVRSPYYCNKTNRNATLNTL